MMLVLPALGASRSCEPTCGLRPVLEVGAARGRALGFFGMGLQGGLIINRVNMDRLPSRFFSLPGQAVAIQFSGSALIQAAQAEAASLPAGALQKLCGT